MEKDICYDTLQVAYDVSQALREDIGIGDLSASLLPPQANGVAHVIARDPCVLAGRPWFDLTLKTLDDQASIVWFYQDGNNVLANTKLCEIHMNLAALLSAERTALNFLQTLSATATKTAAYVACLPQGCQLLDTRKTLPGLRIAQKYAVRCGGGKNHRLGLYDQILLKENHIMAGGGIEAILKRAMTTYPNHIIEVEAETLAECEIALDLGVDMIMLDNFDDAMVEQAVHLRGERKTRFELSGNLSLANISQRHLQGVDYVSIGDLTKNIVAIDLSMRVDQVSE